MKTETDIFKIYKDQILLLSFAATILTLMVVFSFYIIFNLSGQVNQLKSEVAILNEEVVVLEEEVKTYRDEKEFVDIPVETKREVYFTNYYANDGYGTTAKTGSGLSADDFQINSLGWYTYQGKVVVAAATNEGLASSYGVLANYNEPEPGITYYSYYDTIIFEIDGILYEGIILDTCGASMNIDYLNQHDGGVNRLDIFIADGQYSFGKVRGTVYD